MPWYAIVMVAIFAMSAGTTIAKVGEPRDPITPGVALICVVIYALFIWGIVSLAS